jgi:hypothetical protein
VSRLYEQCALHMGVSISPLQIDLLLHGMILGMYADRPEVTRLLITSSESAARRPVGDVVEQVSNAYPQTDPDPTYAARAGDRPRDRPRPCHAYSGRYPVCEWSILKGSPCTHTHVEHNESKLSDEMRRNAALMLKTRRLDRNRDNQDADVQVDADSAGSDDSDAEDPDTTDFSSGREGDASSTSADDNGGRDGTGADDSDSDGLHR